MLHQEYVCIEVSNPLLALLRDAKVTQGIHEIRLYHLPEKVRVVGPQIGGTVEIQFRADPGLGNSLNKAAVLRR